MSQPALKESLAGGAAYAPDGTANVAQARESALAQAEQNARTPAWDPHEVWLNRVKKPREAQADR